MISSYINPASIKFPLESTDRDECIAELVELLVAKNPEINRSEAFNALLLRESKRSTAVFPGMAIPHAVSKAVSKTTIAIGISRKGIEFDSLEPNNYNGALVNVIFEILFNEDNTEEHLHVLRDILNLAGNPDFMVRLQDAANSQEVFDIISELEE